MSPLLIGILIFCMRIADVSIGTIRTIYTIRGRGTIAASLGVVESAIWIVAISKAVTLMQHNPAAMIGWALGFGAGTFTGIAIEKWIASGHIILRIISVARSQELHDALLRAGVGVTALLGEGRERDVRVLFVVAQRKRSGELLEIIQQIDAEAFITIDPINQAIGGYMSLPPAVAATSLRK